MSIQIVSAKTLGGKPLRWLVFGKSKIGKTTTAATASDYGRVLFLSTATEGGVQSLQGRDVDVAMISSVKDMEEAVALLQREPKRWFAVAVDSLTYYVDLWMSEHLARKLQRIRNKSTKGDEGEDLASKMDQQDWGLLESHLMKWLMPSLHVLPLHVFWICLAKDKTDSKGNVLKTIPALQGQSADKLPGACNLVTFMETAWLPSSDGKTMEEHRVLWAKPCTSNTGGPVDAGHWFGGAFASGMIYPHFGSIVQEVGSRIGVGGTNGSTAQAPAPQPEARPKAASAARAR